MFNEPLPTLALCALSGSWYPHRRSDADFVAMGVNLARAICLGTAALKKFNRNIQLVHVDACEHHRALDPRTVRAAPQPRLAWILTFDGSLE